MDKRSKLLNDLGKNKNKYSLRYVVVVAIFIAIISSVITGFVFYNFKGQLVGDKELSDIINTYEKIKSEYYETIDNESLATSAIDGMMSFLEEKYSVYMDNEDTEYLNDKLKGNYEGVGISIVKKTTGEIIILNVYDNTPAFNAGLKANDILIEVNGKKITEEISADEIVNMIKEKRLYILK